MCILVAKDARSRGTRIFGPIAKKSRTEDLIRLQVWLKRFTSMKIRKGDK